MIRLPEESVAVMIYRVIGEPPLLGTIHLTMIELSLGIDCISEPGMESGGTVFGVALTVLDVGELP